MDIEKVVELNTPSLLGGLSEIYVLSDNHVITQDGAGIFLYLALALFPSDKTK